MISNIPGTAASINQMRPYFILRVDITMAFSVMSCNYLYPVYTRILYLCPIPTRHCEE